jgi:hypothetical protein
MLTRYPVLLLQLGRPSSLHSNLEPPNMIDLGTSSSLKWQSP